MRTQMRVARATKLLKMRVSNSFYGGKNVEEQCQDTVMVGKADNRGQHLPRLAQPPIEGA